MSITSLVFGDDFIEYKKLGVSIALDDQKAISIELKELCKNLEVD